MNPDTLKVPLYFILMEKKASRDSPVDTNCDKQRQQVWKGSIHFLYYVSTPYIDEFNLVLNVMCVNSLMYPFSPSAPIKPY